jgi:hypothetical protein
MADKHHNMADSLISEGTLTINEPRNEPNFINFLEYQYTNLSKVEKENAK